MKVYIWPTFAEKDEGDGGVRRIVELQHDLLPKVADIQIVDLPEDADLLAVHIAAPDSLLKQYPRKPMVAHCHGLYWSEYEWAEWALKANTMVMETIRQSSAVTAPSEWVAQAIRRHTLRLVEVVNHGVSLEEWMPRPSAGYVLWNKTRPDPVCDPKPVQDVAALLPDILFRSTFGEPSFNLTITGKLPFEAVKKELEEAVVYLCTTRETFGIGTLEALAAGVPVVAWNWGGQREFLHHRREAWLARPGDLEGLAEGIRWALAHREPMSKAARKEAAKFSREQAASAYADLYQRVLVKTSQKRPKVSVIVTAYNLAEYLPTCLDSVQAQEMADWECIVVDDASPDNCGKIADDYASRDKRFRVVHNQENQYLARARNTGIEVARGEYILPLDADDLLPSAALTLLSNALDEDRSIHIAYGNVEFLELDERRWHSGWPMPFRHDWQLMQRNLLPYSSMFRREVWELTGGYRPRYRTAEDADFWSRASSYGFRPKMVTEADTLIYRNREGSMSRREKAADWISWFPWAGKEMAAPAGAVTIEQLPIPSFDPPVVAVIIPLGPGHEEVVQDAIDSVDAQTFREWECILVNDTGKPLSLRLPSWVRVFDTFEGPRGVAHARNIGIKRSSAPLFLPLDADDYLQPYALETMFQVWQEVKGYVYSDWLAETEGKLVPYQTPEYDAKLLVAKGCIHAVTALYPKDAWKQAKQFDETLSNWEDWDFQIALADQGICGTRVPEPLFVYRKDLGLRREDNYTHFERGKQELTAKWNLWGKEAKELMACRGCPGGGGKVVRPRNQEARGQPAPAAPPSEDVAVVQYIGQQLGARSFRGAATNTIYRFSGDDGGRLKYVYKKDLPLFEGRTDFRILSEYPAREEKVLVSQ